MTGIEYFIIANPIISYSAVFLGMIFEGEGVVLFASVFAWQGHLSWWILGLVVIFGTIIGDCLWYFGAKALKGTRFGGWLDKRFEKQTSWVNENITSNYAKYAFFTKFIYFATKPTIFLVGWHDYPFKKFLKATVITTILWSLLTLILGYFFGYAIHLIGFKKIVHRIEIFATILFVGIFFIERGLKKYFLKKRGSSGN